MKIYNEINGVCIMKLKMVTFTGIDNNTNLQWIKSISEKYPFVEWGVLLDSKRTGIKSRFPSLETIFNIKVLLKDCNISIHLCGNMAQDVANGMHEPLTMAKYLLPNAKRIQINLGRSIESFGNLVPRFNTYGANFDVQIICQCHGLNNHTIKNANDAISKRLVFLNDASGGRGIIGNFDNPVNENLTGYAGGISEMNVTNILQKIQSIPYDNDFWIDMETGVRIQDNFSEYKCDLVLNQVAPYVS